MNSGQQRQREQLIVGSEAGQRSARLSQSRTVVADGLQAGVNDDANLDEEDDSYNPCGEAVHLKNTVYACIPFLFYFL